MHRWVPPDKTEAVRLTGGFSTRAWVILLVIALLATGAFLLLTGDLLDGLALIGFGVIVLIADAILIAREARRRAYVASADSTKEA